MKVTKITTPKGAAVASAPSGKNTAPLTPGQAKPAGTTAGPHRLTPEEGELLATKGALFNAVPKPKPGKAKHTVANTEAPNVGGGVKSVPRHGGEV